MLGQPAFAARLVRGDAQRVALLAEQRVAAVAGAVRLDRQLLGEMHDEAAFGVELADRMQALARSCPRARCAPAPRAPMRVMMRMLATTYGLSVISTPQRDSGESIGPMQYGITYMVRPCMQPSNSASICACASAGAIQWLFGPASSRSRGADEGQVLDARDVVRMRSGAASCRDGFRSLSRMQGAVGLHLRDAAPRSRRRCRRTSGSRRAGSAPRLRATQRFKAPACWPCTRDRFARRRAVNADPLRNAGAARRPRGGSLSGDQRGHHVLDVGLELVVRQARLAAAAGSAAGNRRRPRRPGARGGAASVRQAGLAERGAQVVQAALRDAADHRLHRRVVQRLQQLGIDDVRLDSCATRCEQRAQALARVGDRLELAERRSPARPSPSAPARRRSSASREGKCQ